jgi:hypothetical protein
LNEIEDLKNNVLALQHKLNDIVKMMQNYNLVHDESKEILNLIHNIGFERQKTNHIVFETMMPDIIRRLTIVERYSKSKGNHEYKSGDHFVVNYDKGKKKQRALMIVTEDGIKGFIDNRWVDYWEKR